MNNKTPLITPLLMLTAGMIASVIMYVRGFDLNTMLWNLLIVLIIFYILGDIVRYIYAYLRPRTIPASNIDDEVINALMNGEDVVGNVVVSDDNNGDTDGESGEDAGVDRLTSEDGSGYYDEDGYSDDELGGYDEEEASY